MASRAYPTLVVPLELLAQQAISQLSQLINQGNTASSTFRNLSGIMRTTTSQLAQTGDTARSVGGGIGGFYVMSRALSYSNAMLKAGVNASMDYELALTNLGIKMRSTAEENATLGRMAQMIAMKIGPLDVNDVLHTMGQLSNLMGSTPNRVGAMAETFGSYVSNIVELSEHAFDPDQVATYTSQILNLFGGIEDVNKAMTVLEALHSGIASRASRSLPQLTQALRPIIGPLSQKGMSIKDIISFGVWGTVFPQSTRGGRDINKFFEEVSTIGNLRGKKGQVSKDRLAALQALGIADAGGQAVLFDPATGNANPTRLAQSMAGALGRMQAKEGKDYVRVLTETTGRAFSAQLAKSFASLFGIQGIQNLQELGKATEGNTIQAILEKLSQTSKVSLDRLVTDVGSLASAIFTTPSALVGYASNIGANTAEKLYKDVISHPGLGPGIAGALGLGGIGLSSMITAMMFKGASGMGIGGGLTGAIGTGLGAVGTAGIWGAAISALVVGGIELYQHSEEFRHDVQIFKNAITAFFAEATNFIPQSAKDAAHSLWDMIKGGPGDVTGDPGTGAENALKRQLGLPTGVDVPPGPWDSSVWGKTPGPYVPPPTSLPPAEPPAVAPPVAQHQQSRAKSEREQVGRFKDMHDLMEGIFDRMNHMTQPYAPVHRVR